MESLQPLSAGEEIQRADPEDGADHPADNPRAIFFFFLAFSTIHHLLSSKMLY